MFCKICYDMKKTESCYTGHSIKQGNIVTCPELKKMKCFKCMEFGHMTSYCQLAKPQVKPHVKSQVKPQVKSQVKPQVKPQVKSQVKKQVKTQVKSPNLYNSLSLEDTDEDTDEETYEESKKKSLKISLKIPIFMRSTNSHEIKWKMGFSWAEEME